MELRDVKPGPMSEDDYLALVTRLQQALCIEPFRPSVIDVMLLASEWRMHSAEIERLRATLEQIARSPYALGGTGLLAREALARPKDG